MRWKDAEGIKLMGGSISWQKLSQTVWRRVQTQKLAKYFKIPYKINTPFLSQKGLMIPF